MKKFIYILFLLLFSSSIIYTQITQQWISKYNHKSSADDSFEFVELDNSKNIYVAGISNYQFTISKYNTFGVKLWTVFADNSFGEDNYIAGMKLDAQRNVYITSCIIGPDTSYDILTIKYNTNGVQQWATRYSSGSKNDDIATGVTVDASGNVYVSAYNYHPISKNDFILIKYNANGTQQWVRRDNGPGNGDDFPTAITIDALNNVYITGSTYNPTSFIDFMTLKYDSAGLRLWLVTYDGIGFDEDIPVTIGVDNFNNVFVAGTSYGDTTDIDIAVVKYNSSGVRQWAARYNSPGNFEDIPTAFRITSGGAVYLTGYTYNLFEDYNYLTVKINTTGSVGWGVQFNGSGNADDFAESIDIDNFENVYVTGTTSSLLGDAEFNTIKYNAVGSRQWNRLYILETNFSSEANKIRVDLSGDIIVTGAGFSVEKAYDALILKYNNAGTVLWSERQNNFDNQSYEDIPYAITTDNLGNAYVVGSSFDNGTLYDFLIIKYGTNGDTLWTARYNSPYHDNDEAVAVAVDASKNVYVTGRSYAYHKGDDIVTIKFNENGIVQWIRNFNSSNDSTDRPIALSVDAAGNVYVVGYSFGGNTGYDYITIKYNTNGTQQWVSYFNSSTSSDDFAATLGIDKAGNVYVTGYCTTTTSGNNISTVKYSAAGGQQWVKYYNGPSNSDDFATSIAIDSLGNIIVGGSSVGVGTSNDIVLIKYNPNGDQQWVSRYDGPANNVDYPKSIFVIQSGEIYVGGWSFGTTSYADMIVLKYSSNGGRIWEARYNDKSNDYDYLEGMIVDQWGNSYISGTTGGSQKNNYATIKYNTAGELQWVAYYANQTSTADEVIAMAMDNLGNIFVTGAEYDSLDYSDVITIKYRQTTFMSGSVFYDLNNNGVKDETDPPLAGWNVRISGPKRDSVTTNINGQYAFADIPFGNYTLSQAINPGWIQTLPVGGGAYSVSISFGNLSAVHNFGNYSTTAISYSVDAKWNMLSLPLRTTDRSKTSIFGSANSSAFTFDNSYVVHDSLAYLKGYWLKFPSAHQIWLAGSAFDADSIDLKTGWNMIGCTSNPFPVKSLITNPPNIIRSPVYAFLNGYSISDTIKPSKGYWVKVSQGGKLIMRPGSTLSKHNSLAEDMINQSNKLFITDKGGNSCVLYFGSFENASFDAGYFLAPPRPPADVFDVRFDGESYLFNHKIKKENKINISASEYPIKISWEILTGENYELVTTKGKLLTEVHTSSGSFVLDDKNHTVLYLKYSNQNGETDIPTDFALSQNYPNPFNPVTIINYQLPRVASGEHRVTLKVYNLLGQEVATLVDEQKPAGRYEVRFSTEGGSDYGGDGSQLSSGVFFYRLVAGNFSDIKKLIILK